MEFDGGDVSEGVEDAERLSWKLEKGEMEIGEVASESSHGFDLAYTG